MTGVQTCALPISKSNTTNVTISADSVGSVNINLNFTDLPYYSNSTRNISFMPTGNTSSYNVTFTEYNGTASYFTYTVYNWLNNTLYSNETDNLQHAGETWNLTASIPGAINSTTVLISNTRPDLPADISPTPANSSETNTLTPTINISVDDIDGNNSLNCHFYFGTTASPTYNTTTQTNANGICEWTTPALSDLTTYYWKVKAGDSELNSSFTPIKNFITGIGDINANLNFTDLPYYTGSALNISFDIIGNQSSYNVTYNISNGSVQYLQIGRASCRERV